LARSLPAVVRELNRSDLDGRTVPRLILNLAESIFEPEQILFYGSRRMRGNEGVRFELDMLAQKGLVDIPKSITRIPVGIGKIGWVAEHSLDMLREDWQQLSRSDGLNIQDNHPTLKLDIVGPLLHHAEDGEQVLGVLCIGAPGVRPRDEKLMFQMVTNLGSLALVNASNVTRLRQLANTDGLTGLMNKRYFMHELASLIVTAEREAQPLALFIFDIDHFKNYNDTNGHPAGDELLRTLARVLKDQLRPRDWCCRYGGEEFMVVMPRTERDAAFKAAERIRQAIEEHEFADQRKQPTGNLTISGGLAVFPTEGGNIEELIENADRALYKSKSAGRNRVSRARSLGFGDLDDDTDTDLEPAASSADVTES